MAPARRSDGSAPLDRSHPRSAEGRRQCRRSQRLNARGDRWRLLAATLLGGCSDIYYDRRDTVSLARRRCGGRQHGHADGRSVAARTAANRNIAFDGERAAAARRALPHRPSHPAGQRHAPARPPTAAAAAGAVTAATASAASAPMQPQHQQVTAAVRHGIDDAHAQGLERGEQDARRGGAHRDAGFEQSGALDVRRRAADRARQSCPARSPSVGASFDTDGATVVIVDLDAGRAERDARRWSG